MDELFKGGDYVKFERHGDNRIGYVTEVTTSGGPKYKVACEQYEMHYHSLYYGHELTPLTEIEKALYL